MKIKKFQNPSGKLQLDMSKAPSGTIDWNKEGYSFQIDPEKIKQAAKIITEKDPMYKEYQKYASTYKDPVSFSQWKAMQQKDNGTITTAEKVNPVSRAVNEYTRELKWDLSQGNIPKGKHVVPLALATGTGIGAIAQTPLFVNLATMGGGMLTEKAVDKLSQLTTGNSAAQNLSNLTGLDIEPAQAVTSTVTGIPGGAWGWKSLKRGVETAMRTTLEENPLDPIIQGILTIPKEDPKRALDISKYIFTGKRGKTFGSYNSFARNINGDPGIDGTYGGFTDALAEPNDIIDAFLYRKPIGSKYGLKEVPQDFGIHQDYVFDNYNGKSKYIRTYETTPPNRFRRGSMNPTKISEPIEVDSNNPFTTMYKKQQYTPNVAGHKKIQSISDDGYNIEQHWDIWKFNPDDYIKRWKPENYKIKDADQSKKWMKPLLKEGLKTVDYYGTPIIFKTPWILE